MASETLHFENARQAQQPATILFTTARAIASAAGAFVVNGAFAQRRWSKTLRRWNAGDGFA